jgi:vancomycin permeability regulator SanA
MISGLWRVGRRLKISLLLAGAVFLSAATLIAASGLRDEFAPAAAIVVLGNTVGPDGEPSPRLKGRLDGALSVYRKGFAPRIVVSGGVGREGFDEAAVMAQYLVRQGVPANAVLIDSKGVDTAATAANVAGMGKARGIRSVIVATQYFHVSRTKVLLTQAGLKVVGSVHAPYFEARDLYSLPREVIALAAWYAGLKDRA